MGSWNAGDKDRSGHIHRMPVVAAMARTWHKAKAASTDFWTKIRDDCEDPVGSPPRKLFRWLLSHGSTRGHVTGKERCTSKEIMVRCLHAWNAWRKGESTEMKYYPASKIPSAA